MKKANYWIDIEDILGSVYTIRCKDIRAIINEKLGIKVYLHIADDRLNIITISLEEYNKIIKKIKKYPKKMRQAAMNNLIKELTNSTKTTGGDFGGRHVCSYCGKTAKEKVVGKWDTYYYCDCEDAKKEQEINQKIVELLGQIPKEKYIVQECIG